jgi:hypothetical protein
MAEDDREWISGERIFTTRKWKAVGKPARAASPQFF